MEDLVELINIISPFEKWSSTKQFRENASNGPHINCLVLVGTPGIKEKKPTSFRVTLETQHDLGCTIPSGCNILGHVPRIFLRVHRETSGQSKIANLQLTIGIDQQVTRFQIAMENVGRVNIFQTAEDLVDEGLEMCIGERLP